MPEEGCGGDEPAASPRHYLVPNRAGGRPVDKMEDGNNQGEEKEERE